MDLNLSIGLPLSPRRLPLDLGSDLALSSLPLSTSSADVSSDFHAPPYSPSPPKPTTLLPSNPDYIHPDREDEDDEEEEEEEDTYFPSPPMIPIPGFTPISSPDSDGPMEIDDDDDNNPNSPPPPGATGPTYDPLSPYYFPPHSWSYIPLDNEDSSPPYAPLSPPYSPSSPSYTRPMTPRPARNDESSSRWDRLDSPESGRYYSQCNMAERGRGRGRKDAEEEEEENHRNPFLSTNPNFKPSSSKIQFRKELSRARWDEEMGMAEIVEKKGSMWATTGIVRSGNLYCHVEEILFLAERGALLLSDCNDTTLNLKDIYKKIANSKDGCSWDCFEAYRHLKSLGYIVGRYGIPWTLKSGVDCCSSKSCDEVESNLSTMFKDMQLEEMKPMFCVYPPNSKFRKSSPGNPSFLLCVLRDNPPSRAEVESLEEKCDGIPLKLCFVDHGRISFFRFDKVTLPTLP